MTKRQIIHNYIYLIGLILLAFFMPLKISFTSFCQFLLLFNYIIEGDFKNKYKRLKENKDIIIFSFSFFASLIWFINSEDLAWAWKDLVIKLPLLILPIIIGTSKKLSKKKIYFILSAMITATLFNTICGYLNYKGIINITKEQNLDFRILLSPFINSIRTALLVSIAIYSLVYLLFIEKIKNTKIKLIHFITLIPILIWFVFFLTKIEGFTAIIAIIASAFFILLYSCCKEKNKKKKIIKTITLIVFPCCILCFLSIKIINYFTPTTKFTKTETTIQGNNYDKMPNSYQKENGNLVYNFICEKEIIENWSKYSNYDIHEKSNAGNSLYFVLIRYMTSKGLKKDAEGLSKLNKEDIKNIENGETNYKYIKNHGIDHRIYTIINGLENYYYTGDPSGFSVAQRLEYQKVGINLFVDNFFFGCGTGDIKTEYNNYYETHNSKLAPQYRHRAHNQFLTCFICYGIFGGLLSLFSWFYPAYKNRKKINYFFACFFITATISMFSDDMFETATAVAFVALFYSIFLWGYENKKNA